MSLLLSDLVSTRGVEGTHDNFINQPDLSHSGNDEGITISLSGATGAGDTVIIINVEIAAGYNLQQAQIINGQIQYWVEEKEGAESAQGFWDATSEVNLLEEAWTLDIMVLGKNGSTKKRGAWVFAKSKGNTLIVIR